MYEERDRKKIYSIDLSMNSNIEKMKTFLEEKESSDVFKRKIKIIKKHLKDKEHPLKILLELFTQELKNL